MPAGQALITADPEAAAVVPSVGSDANVGMNAIKLRMASTSTFDKIFFIVSPLLRSGQNEEFEPGLTTTEASDEVWRPSPDEERLRQTFPHPPYIFAAAENVRQRTLTLATAQIYEAAKEPKIELVKP